VGREVGNFNKLTEGNGTITTDDRHASPGGHHEDAPSEGHASDSGDADAPDDARSGVTDGGEQKPQGAGARTA